ncbi:hypothetical protein LINGRAHAP2_LOCUS2055 [Linum grandiflorum]
MPRRNYCSLSNGQVRAKKSKPLAARRKDDGDDSDSAPQPRNIPIGKLVASSAKAVLGLGFVDAGYSGDWSRIGAISKETEDLLKVASILVALFCVLIVISISKQEES